mmetsp:Transcript_2512/g.4197  ORF Transcript_2512/g.4197 Transcript_2512/m.4197 type:complete len:129 (+) Transcript_2512:38-424(+)
MGVCTGATSCVSGSILRYLGPMSPNDVQVKKKSKSEVTIERNVRNKRKCITTVRGLENFNIKLADASKLFGKKFACGASVVKGPADKDQIDIQGDFQDDLVEFILEKFKEVAKDNLYFLEKERRTPAC